MKRLAISVLLAIWALGGCAAPYQQIKGDRVYLYLKVVDGQAVYLASSLDGFQRHPLVRQTQNTWCINLPADQEFTYFYIVDNQPIIPACPYKEKDDFGFENCIFLPDL